MAAVVSMALLLFLAWQIKGMETEIHSLSLSDELTKLYNLKGFHLLAGQALRLAYRAHAPFSVLFIDLDNLKQINDAMGHTAGSAFLTETAEILGATFRETDVLGRIGGDEFAVAGQFSEEAISIAIQRLEEGCAKRNAQAGRRFALSFSVGHVTTLEEHKETLDELLTKADQVMYEAKRSKKEGQPRDEQTWPDKGQEGVDLRG
jgi:diguanylate cyclase (GGDEF)-like protein